MVGRWDALFSLRERTRPNGERENQRLIPRVIAPRQASTGAGIVPAASHERPTVARLPMRVWWRTGTGGSVLATALPWRLIAERSKGKRAETAEAPGCAAPSIC